jgi:hypothetical protein
MKKHIISFVLGFLLAGAVVFLIMHHRARRDGDASAAIRLIAVRAEVEKRLQETSSGLVDRLAAFGREAASDQLFSLRLFAENNPSAPEVAGLAGRFMRPMGFSLLEIVDPAGTIISSGHFPASRGNRIPEKLRGLSDEPKIAEDNVAGEKLLTLQARTSFTVADSIKLYAMGGAVVDETFLESLSPMPDVRVLLRRGGAIMGMQVKTISEVKDDRIIINDRTYPALVIPIASAGLSADLSADNPAGFSSDTAAAAAELIVVLTK